MEIETLSKLKEDEIAWIGRHPERCKACGHLVIFHNEHCCLFCLVDGCECKWDEMPVGKEQ